VCVREGVFVCGGVGVCGGGGLERLRTGPRPLTKFIHIHTHTRTHTRMHTHTHTHTHIHTPSTGAGVMKTPGVRSLNESCHTSYVTHIDGLCHTYE